MPRALVIGGTGLLGQYLREAAASSGFDVVATRRGTGPVGLPGSWIEWDLSHQDAIRGLVKDTAADTILNAAAMTDVDGCEREPVKAKQINAIAPGDLADAARQAGAVFVHFSTDYVFDGTGPATEVTNPNPLGVYGRTKLEGERRVLSSNPKALVLRLSAVFGWNRVSAKTNAVTWILQKLEIGETVSLFHDQRISPTYAKTAAETVLDLCAQHRSGIFHVACKDCLSRVEMGKAIADVFAIPMGRIESVPMSSVSFLAKRPKAPCLVVAKVEETLKKSMPTFRVCLENMRATR